MFNFPETITTKLRRGKNQLIGVCFWRKQEIVHIKRQIELRVSVIRNAYINGGDIPFWLSKICLQDIQ